MSIEPYNEYKDRINIRAISIPSPESGTDIPHKNIWKNTPLNSKFNTFNSERYLTVIDYHTLYDYAALAPCDQICILVNTPEYGGGGIYNFWNLTSAKHPYFNEIFAHELGHSFAALADEYCDSDASTENMYNLNNEPYEANITTLIDFDSKWKNIIEKNVPVPTPEEEKYFDKIGVYEGAAYKTKGIYRPYINCKMKSLNADFCPICKKTIAKTIKIYID